ncbi:hypothetical protein [Nocardiopsis sp. NRRL B-16309]|uniref:hypothetical protein n=1 Tax=Nocardiopsis sp. NRRL B-16309 TaxID=1519494 RepID=UPI0006AD8713|nr:hypothetical protein [Nocardiopsis sp. NRRL B-16309]KOX11837.1 hypothetical protein ADL05_23030 [Nocardiopsis sp. NRRL B-16309]
MPTYCDSTMVAVLITADDELVLVQHQLGMGAPAAHALALHSTWIRAAREETAAQTGLSLVDAHAVTSGRLPDRCTRPLPWGRAPGHTWQWWQGRGQGQVRRPCAAPRTGWYDRGEAQYLAELTLEHARGHRTDAEHTQEPGLIAAHALWMHRLGVIELATDDRALMAKLCA